MKQQMSAQQRRRSWLDQGSDNLSLPVGRSAWGHFGQKCPKFENFVWTKMGSFGKFWDQTFMGIIRGPVVSKPWLFLAQV